MTQKTRKCKKHFRVTSNEDSYKAAIESGLELGSSISLECTLFEYFSGKTVIPAQADIQIYRYFNKSWIPAFAGMTIKH